MNKPTLSVIIPCYNQGCFLPEALMGVNDQKDIEIIIVNDGSTDQETIELFKNLDRTKYVIIEQENKGLSNSRNIAIEKAKADYILALDADNIVMPEYYRKAIQILDENPATGVVYSNPLFFGVRNEPIYLEDFNFPKVLHANYIDACAIYRKEAWVQAGGYDVNMPVQGYEDWELWITIAKNGWKFHHLEEFLFKYRTKEVSMITNCILPENQKKLLHYIRTKHKDLYVQQQFDIISYLDSNIQKLTHQIVNERRDFIEKEKIYKKRIAALEEATTALHQDLTLLHAKAESMRIKNRLKRFIKL
jgi:glycosyltransferase involved in cell wall biosynthesis